MGIPKESWHGERRVAITPQVAATLVKKGFSVNIESGAGIEANFKDAGTKNITLKRKYSFAHSFVSFSTTSEPYLHSLINLNTEFLPSD